MRIPNRIVTVEAYVVAGEEKWAGGMIRDPRSPDEGETV